MVVVKIKVLTDLRRKTKNDGTVVFNFVAISSEDKMVHGNMKESSRVPAIRKDAFLAINDSRVVLRDDGSFFMEILDDTKVV